MGAKKYWQHPESVASQRLDKKLLAKIRRNKTKHAQDAMSLEIWAELGFKPGSHRYGTSDREDRI